MAQLAELKVGFNHEAWKMRYALVIGRGFLFLKLKLN